MATIERVIAAIIQHPHRDVLLVDGYFHADLAALEGNRHGEDIVAEIATVRLEEMTAHFLPCEKSWERYGIMWCMRRHGREVRSRLG